MNLNYLIDPNMQFQDRNGVNNVAGFLRVYYEGSDDRATTYKNFNGTLNPADIPLDNNGRAVVIVDDEKTYRLEVYERNGNLQWTQHPLHAQGGGGGSFEQVQSNWDEEDPTSASFIKNKPDLDNFIEKDGDGKDVTVTFNEASERSNIGTGEKLSVLFGKIKKWLSDLKAVAFSGSYNDLSDKPSIPAAQVQSDWNQSNSSAVDYIKNKPQLASVATSGLYNDLSGRPLPANIISEYGPWTEQLTADDVSNGYKDFTKILQYGEYPNLHNFTFLTNYALVSVSLTKFEGLVGQTSFPATYFTFEVFAGNETNPTKVLIRSVTKTDLTDEDDRGVPIQDLQVNPVWNCQLLGSQFLVVCDRITVRVKWKNSSFGSTGNRIKASFTVAAMNPSGMTEWPQE